MDSSFGKNAANRIEEAYGDAKNLKSRHPLAAHGFLYGLRSTILESEPDKAEWLIDLLGKLAREHDAYDSVCLLLLEYEGAPPEGSDGGHEDEADAAAASLSNDTSVIGEPVTAEEQESIDPDDTIARDLKELPKVRGIDDPPHVPEPLSAGAFFEHIVRQVLETTPVTMHSRARSLRDMPTVRSIDGLEPLADS